MKQENFDKWFEGDFGRRLSAYLDGSLPESERGVFVGDLEKHPELAKEIRSLNILHRVDSLLAAPDVTDLEWNERWVGIATASNFQDAAPEDEAIAALAAPAVSGLEWDRVWSGIRRGAGFAPLKLKTRKVPMLFRLRSAFSAAIACALLLVLFNVQSPHSVDDGIGTDDANAGALSRLPSSIEGDLILNEFVFVPPDDSVTSVFVSYDESGARTVEYLLAD